MAWGVSNALALLSEVMVNAVGGETGPYVIEVFGGHWPWMGAGAFAAWVLFLDHIEREPSPPLDSLPYVADPQAAPRRPSHASDAPHPDSPRAKTSRPESKAPPGT